MASNFEVLGPAGSKTLYFEIFDLYLIVKRQKSSFAPLLRHFMLSQNTPKSYHKMQIVRELLSTSCRSTTGKILEVISQMVLKWDHANHFALTEVALLRYRLYYFVR